MTPDQARRDQGKLPQRMALEGTLACSGIRGEGGAQHAMEHAKPHPGCREKDQEGTDSQIPTSPGWAQGQAAPGGLAEAAAEGS